MDFDWLVVSVLFQCANRSLHTWHPHHIDVHLCCILLNAENHQHDVNPMRMTVIAVRKCIHLQFETEIHYSCNVSFDIDSILTIDVN